MQRGRKPGATKTGGRQRGVPNKVTLGVKEAIALAFAEVGAKDYLVELAKSDPRTFCALVGKLVPTTVGGDPDNPIQLGGKFEIGFVNPKANRVP